MSTITKKQIVDMVAESTELPKKDVKEVIESFFENVETIIASGGKVQLQSIGYFEAREAKERIARNPKNLEEQIVVPACKKPVFKFSSVIKDRINA